MLKKIFKDTAIYGMSPYVPKIASFFILPIITKDLTAFDYAVSGLIMAYTSAISVLGSLGLRVVLVNWFYKAPCQFKWAWRQIYGFFVFWTFPFAAINVLIIYIAVPPQAQHNLWQIVLLNTLPFVLFAGTNTIANTYYQVKKMPMQIAFRTVVFGVLTVVLNLYTISYLKMGYMGWFWSTFFVTILQNLSFWYPINFKLKLTPILNFKPRFIKQCLKVSLPTVPHYYASFLLDISDRVVMNFLKVPVGDIGKYNFSYTFGNYFQSITNASGLAVNPVLYEFYKKGDERGARNLVFLLQAIILLLTCICCLWMKEIFSILIKNEELASLYPLAIIIVMAYNYRPMYFGANLKLMYHDKTNKLWRVTFVAGIVNVALNLIGIPFFGFQFAAYSTFISLMYMGYVGYFTQEFKRMTTENYYPFFWLFLTVGLAFIARFLSNQSVYFKLSLTITLITFGIYGIKKYKEQLVK